VLQLRTHPRLIALREHLRTAPRDRKHQVQLTYITGRGQWYHVSWKGQAEKSGGVPTNIGIHLFDLLIWLFGPVRETRVYMNEPTRMTGFIELERADVTWWLSVEPGDLPFAVEAGKRSTFRSITVDGQEIEFSDGFTDLHTRVYEETLAGRGFGIDDARPSVELAHRLRTATVVPRADPFHPYLACR
jgi:UDP-N-acetyl-2-amino-2-deoxyglucuronate dehydrogenase